MQYMDTKLKIGITGISGLVGTSIANRLSSYDNIELRGLHLSGFKPKILLQKNIEWIQGDLSEVGVLEDFVKDFVIHTAAIVSFQKKNKDKMFLINVEGTRDLVNNLLRSKTKLIHISSIATLGRKEGAVDIDEDDFWNENLPHTDYAESKFLAEMEIYRGISEGLNAMIFQPSIILGQSERGTSSVSILNQITKMPWFAPQGSTGFVDVEDISTYVYEGIINWKSGSKLILNGVNLSYLSFYQLVLNHLGSKAKVRAGNVSILLFLLPFFRLAFSLIGKPTEISKAAIISTSKSHSYNNTKSIALYGNKYTPIEKTISRYLLKN